MFTAVICQSSAVPGAESTRPPVLAVIDAADVGKTGVADLLMVRLGKRADIQLVEREAVAKACAELKLNAAEVMRADRTLALGKIVSADAFLFIEHGRAGSGLCRARLVEMRTGVRLCDLYWNVKKHEDGFRQLDEALPRALVTLRATPAERHYVGILRLRSEEPGRVLAGPAQSLAVLIETDLARLPKIVTLEREQLKRLTAERNLTAAELSLRTSATLVEGGMRRDGQQWAITLQMMTLADKKVRTVRVATKQDVSAARKAIVEALAAALAVRPVAAGNVPQEAAALSLRASWIGSNGDLADAAALHDAVYALEPTKGHYYSAYWGHLKIAQDSRRHPLERMLAALHANEIDTQYFNNCLAVDPTGDNYSVGSLFMSMVGRVWQDAPERLRTEKPYRYTGSWTEDDQRQARDLQQQVCEMQLEKFTRLLTARRAKRLTCVGMYLARVKTAAALSENSGEYITVVKQLLAELREEERGGHIRLDFSDGNYRQFYKDLTIQVGGLAHMHSEASAKNAVAGQGPSENKELLRPLLDWFLSKPDNGMRVLGHYGGVKQSGDRGAKSARQVMEEIFFPTVPRNASTGDAYDSAVRRALERMTLDRQLGPYMDELLSRAEKKQDASFLFAAPHEFALCLMSGNAAQMDQWRVRYEAMLKNKWYKPNTADGVQEVAAKVKGYYDLHYRRAQFAPLAAGPWANYAVRPLNIENRPPNDRLTTVYVDSNQAVGAAAGSIVTVWRGAQPTYPNAAKPGAPATSELVVARLKADGGPLREVCRMEAKNVPLMAITTSPAAVVFALYESPVTVIDEAKKPAEVRYLRKEQGMPDQTVEGLAWLDDWLYVVYPGTLGRVNLRKPTFEMIATSRSVEPRHPLDGGTLYHIRAILADAERKCLWLAVEDRSLSRQESRTGLWKYTPAGGRFEKLFAGGVEDLNGCDGKYIFQSMNRLNGVMGFQQFDPATGTTSPMRGYRPFGGAGWVFFNNHIFSTSGHLFSNDGIGNGYLRSPNMRWTSVQRLGSGVLAGADNSLWYIAPQADGHPGKPR